MIDISKEMENVAKVEECGKILKISANKGKHTLNPKASRFGDPNSCKRRFNVQFKPELVEIHEVEENEEWKEYRKLYWELVLRSG